MYQYVRCGTSAFNSYYLPHIPNFQVKFVLWPINTDLAGWQNAHVLLPIPTKLLYRCAVASLKINKLCLLSENNLPDCFLSASAFRRKIVPQTIFTAAVLRFFPLKILLLAAYNVQFYGQLIQKYQVTLGLPEGRLFLCNKKFMKKVRAFLK